MSDDIRQQLEEAWPGEWDGDTFRKCGHGISAEVHLILDGTGVPVIFIGVMRVWQADDRMPLDDAALALRARAEILVDALERMDALDDGPSGLDALVGQWPGDETDEEIDEALEDLS